MSDMTLALQRASSFQGCEYLTVRQLTALLVLAEHKIPVKHRVLADAIGVPRPALTRIVDTLTRAKLVERHQNKEDGRDRLLVLSERGAEAVRFVIPDARRAA